MSMAHSMKRNAAYHQAAWHRQYRRKTAAAWRWHQSGRAGVIIGSINESVYHGGAYRRCVCGESDVSAWRREKIMKSYQAVINSVSSSFYLGDVTTAYREKSSSMAAAMAS